MRKLTQHEPEGIKAKKNESHLMWRKRSHCEMCFLATSQPAAASLRDLSFHIAKTLHNEKHNQRTWERKKEKSLWIARKLWRIFISIRASKEKTFFLKLFLNKALGKFLYFSSNTLLPDFHGNYFNKCFWFFHARVERRNYSSYLNRFTRKDWVTS